MMYNLLLLSLLFILLQSGTYKQNERGSDACRGSNRLWIGRLKRYKRVGLPECVVSTISGPPLETQEKGTASLRIGIKISDPAGNLTRASGLESWDFTDHAMTTNIAQPTQNIVALFFSLRLSVAALWASAQWEIGPGDCSFLFVLASCLFGLII